MKSLLKIVVILVVAYIVVTLVWKNLGIEKLKELLPQVEAEKMNDECANKLLKMLEEPFLDSLFILVSENSAIIKEHAIDDL